MADLAIADGRLRSVPICFTANAQNQVCLLRAQRKPSHFIGKLDNLHEGLPAIAPAHHPPAFLYENVPNATNWAQMLAQPYKGRAAT